MVEKKITPYFIEEIYAKKEEFDPRSFRIIIPKKGRYITIGCPKGQWDEKSKRCRVGTRIHKLTRIRRMLTPTEEREVIRRLGLTQNQWRKIQGERVKVREMVKTYRKFHGIEPRKVIRLNLPEKVVGFLLGTSPAITYYPIEGSVKRPHKYIHWFNDKVLVVWTGRFFILYPIKGKVRVSDWIRG